MLVYSIFGLALSVVALSTLVAGDPGSIVTITSLKVTNNPNDYFDDWAPEIHKTKKSSQLSTNLPTKKEIPDTMQMKFVINMKDQDPIESTMSVCDALNDETIGKSFANAGIPKDKFPKECPFVAGDWAISKWDPPAEKIPPGTPDGPFTGTLSFMEEGKDPYVHLEFEGELSHRGP